LIGIVRTALARPLSFVVMAIAILILGVLAAVRMPVDIFPSIRVPVIAISWTYAGLSSEEMAGRIITLYERVLTTGVSDIEGPETRK
jgi:multidrug efflux pump subunit AcrB